MRVYRGLFSSWFHCYNEIRFGLVGSEMCIRDSDNCSSADDLNVGDDVEISYQLSGRKWQRDPDSEVKYFLTAEALSFKKLGEGGAPDADSGSANDAFSESNYDEGDIPF